MRWLRRLFVREPQILAHGPLDPEEVDGDGYARVSVSFGSSDETSIDFPASGDWGTVTYFAVYDAAGPRPSMARAIGRGGQRLARSAERVRHPRRARRDQATWPARRGMTPDIDSAT